MSLISHTPEACRGAGRWWASCQDQRCAAGIWSREVQWDVLLALPPHRLLSYQPLLHCDPHVNKKGALELKRGKKGSLSERLPRPRHCARHWEGQGQRWKGPEDVSQWRLSPGHLVPER